jgi:hypothetical protein
MVTVDIIWLNWLNYVFCSYGCTAGLRTAGVVRRVGGPAAPLVRVGCSRSSARCDTLPDDPHVRKMDYLVLWEMMWGALVDHHCHHHHRRSLHEWNESHHPPLAWCHQWSSSSLLLEEVLSLHHHNKNHLLRSH